MLFRPVELPLLSKTTSNKNFVKKKSPLLKVDSNESFGFMTSQATMRDANPLASRIQLNNKSQILNYPIESEL